LGFILGWQNAILGTRNFSGSHFPTLVLEHAASPMDGRPLFSVVLFVNYSMSMSSSATQVTYGDKRASQIDVCKSRLLVRVEV
jgi:hypothetical protein